MIKHLRFLIVLLMTLVWSAGWAAIGDTFKLVTDANDLKAGDKIIIGSKDSKVVLGADNGNTTKPRRKAVPATFSNDGVVAWKEGFDVITLEGAASAWYLCSEVNSGYIFAYVDNTYLKTSSDKNSVNTASIIFNKDYSVNITFNGVTTAKKRYVLYNTQAKYFGYYTTQNTTSIQIYKLVNSADKDKTSTTLSFNTETTAFNVEKKSEGKFVAPKAVVKDAADNVVAGAKITYKSDNDAVASVGENGNVTFGSDFGKATITASYAGDDTHKAAADISYTITYSKIPTEMAWSESSVSVNIGELPSLPTLKLTAHGEDIRAGKTITYSSSDEEVAMIDQETGDIVLMDKDGSTNITAKFVGDDTYAEATAKYTLNVIDPNKTDVTFDFTKPEDYGYAKPEPQNKTELSEGNKLESQSVVITNVKGGTSTTTRFFNNSKDVVTFRVYAGAILTVEAPAGSAINKIDFTDSSNGGKGSVNNFTFSTGERNLNTWTGLTKKLTMEVPNGQVFLLNMTVNLVKVENVTFEETATNNIEAKALANVTLKRTMKAGVWNTFCVPFSIDATQIASQFGEGTQIAKFEDSIDDEIQFTTLTSNEIVAGEPYLVKPINAADSYSFTNVSVAATDPITKGEGEYISFKGIYNPTDITKGLHANTFAAGIVGNVVKKAVSGSNMNGFRAFFIIPGGEGAPSSYMLKIDGTATSINTINGAVVVDAPVYNLQGQRVDGNSLTPGIYVKAGKKFVVK